MKVHVLVAVHILLFRPAPLGRRPMFPGGECYPEVAPVLAGTLVPPVTGEEQVLALLVHPTFS